MIKESADIAKFVRMARDKLDFTQEQLANNLGCSKANVSAWENGLHQPSYIQLCKMSEQSGVPLPHESENKAQEMLSMLGIDPDLIDNDQIEIIRNAMKTPERDRTQLRRVVAAFSDQYDDQGKKKTPCRC